MEIEQNLAARVDRLERLMNRLLAGGASDEGAAVAAVTQPTERAPAPDPDPSFVLHALKQVLPAPGGVVFAGAVDLPGGRHADWQYGLDTGTLTGEDWSGRADSIAALAHPVRLKLVQEVLLGMATVGQLSALDGVGTSGQIYHHLRTLTAAGWLQSTGRGRYEVPAVHVVPLLVLILAVRR